MSGIRSDPNWPCIVEPGERLLVFIGIGGGEYEPPQGGTMQTFYDKYSDDNPMPIIKMDDGRVVRGCECWWIPRSVISGLGEHV